MNNILIKSDNRIEIPLSKLKLVLLTIGSVVFVIVGVFFVLKPSEFQNSWHHHYKGEIIGIGYAGIIFFGAGVVLFAFKLFDKKPGLLVDGDGITINPGSSTNSFINWASIDKFGIIEISRTKLIQVYLKNPEEFIDLQSNAFKRKLAQWSFKNYGTPVSISAGTLKCNTNELYNLLTDKLKAIK